MTRLDFTKARSRQKVAASIANSITYSTEPARVGSTDGRRSPLRLPPVGDKPVGQSQCPWCRVHTRPKNLSRHQRRCPKRQVESRPKVLDSRRSTREEAIAVDTACDGVLIAVDRFKHDRVPARLVAQLRAAIAAIEQRVGRRAG